MKRSSLLKALTLCSFFSLLALFLFYRTGKLDTYIYSEGTSLQTSPNGGPVHRSKEDSIKHRRDSLKKIRMSSSKSGGPFSTEDIHMSSSKSGPVFEIERDTVKKKDTTKKK
jgi:hypothetical protein